MVTRTFQPTSMVANMRPARPGGYSGQGPATFKLTYYRFCGWSFERGQCQVSRSNPVKPRSGRPGPALSWRIRSRFARPPMSDSGARARVAGTIGAVGVDVEGPRGALDDLRRDHHFLDPLEARQIEHRVEQDA